MAGGLEQAVHHRAAHAAPGKGFGIDLVRPLVVEFPQDAEEFPGDALFVRPGSRALDEVRLVEGLRFVRTDDAGAESCSTVIPHFLIDIRSRLPGFSFDNGQRPLRRTGWKTQYDKYNDVVRYVPLCADVAGLCARTDKDRGCHWSPAGYNRGLIKNVNALVWNVENKDDRDELYQMGINPFMTVIGTGTLMFGDRTGTTRKTAFREIGIRRWFMKIEKAIANYAKYVLFEFNDAFTRSQFINVVNPYLRNEQGARACQDYVIQCDEQVNTPEVIDAQGFVANFLIKPMHSINFIQLNFAAVATGASFEEIELY